MTTDTNAAPAQGVFGHYLRTQRKRAGLTQRELAEVAGVDFTYISKLENNAAPAPSIQTLRRMADAFGVTDAQMCAAAGRMDSDLTKQEMERYVLQLLAMHENYQAVTNSHIARMTEALEWYADESNYNDHHQLGKTAKFEVGEGLHQVVWIPDNGKRARAALAGSADAEE